MNFNKVYGNLCNENYKDLDNFFAMIDGPEIISRYGSQFKMQAKDNVFIIFINTEIIDEYDKTDLISMGWAILDDRVTFKVA